MKLHAVHILQLHLSIKDTLKVSKTTYFTLYKLLHGSALGNLFVTVDSFNSINRKPPLII